MTRPADYDDAALEELLGAYALDAVEPHEVEAVEQYLARTPEAVAEVDRLRTVAAWIAASEALSPPPRLRDAVLGAVRTAGERDTGDEPLAAYVAETDRFDALVADLPADRLGRRTANGLTIHELVIHLAAMESLLAATIGVATEPGIDQTNIERRTAAFIARYRDGSMREARAAWRRAVDAVRNWAARPDNARAQVAVYDLFFDRDNLLLARSFETWTHGDDIRSALDRPGEPPGARSLHRMAHMSVVTLPIGLEVQGRAHRGKSARIVLTGPGGGSWLIPLGRGDAAEPADLVLTVDTIHWCRLVAERISPGSLPHTVEGDASLVDDLASAASAFAML